MFEKCVKEVYLLNYREQRIEFPSLSSLEYYLDEFVMRFGDEIKEVCNIYKIMVYEK